MSFKQPFLINAPLLRFSAVIATLILLLALFPTLQSEARFERAGIDAGQFWRLLTANLVHTNFTHALLNAAGLVLLPLMFERPARVWPWAIALIVCSLGTGLGLYFFTPLSWYVGLSGALHGLFLFGALASAPQLKSRETLIGLCVLAKIIWESLFGAELGTEQLIGASVVTEAHAFGGITGILAGCIFLLGRKLSAHAVPSD